MRFLKENFTIFFIIFLCFVGFSISIPIFPQILLSPDNQFFSDQTSTILKSTLLGCLIAAYPFGQFLSCPFLGRLSDTYGRKRIFLILIAFLFPCHILVALSITYSNLALLFVSWFLCGIFGGSIVIANAALSDYESNNAQSKIQHFGWIVSFVNIGYIVGPIIGGVLSDTALVPWFNAALPFWFILFLLLLKLFFVFFCFKDTSKKQSKHHTRLSAYFSHFKGSFAFKELKGLFVGNFLVYMGIFFFYTFLPTYLFLQFQFSRSHIGLAQAYISFPALFAPMVYARSHLYFSHQRTLKITALLLAVATFSFLFISSPVVIFLSLVPIGLLVSMGITYSTVIISDRADQHSQGEALGLNESVLVLSEIMVSLIGGFLISLGNHLPLGMSIIFCLISFFWFLTRKKEREKPLRNE